ncbi:TPA_asm: hypothetical protein GNC10_004112 [Salmonella enterica subsp. salamae serovar 42:z:1,5]|uniref:Uncharacterized protein n=2 Tax=Salmonella enterica TaxID=28901 RepID=A0A3I8FVS6_SALER|nr:hypothetical protein [Salmonella enterica subsp. salamae]ECJ2518814.1 hypothetical protein [Salmonella enterica subsp. salamae]EDV9721763.1 hypothetical protein [Salmonella enterica subsp. salamae]MER41053.1 hypothetical protein [Salmonella enterica]HAE7083421.1 hypothetical protein [Salmonella enterica subsp. salamae serovar 42:z:1,5]
MNGIHRARLLLLPEEGNGRLHDVFWFAGIIREISTFPWVSEQSREGGQLHYCRYAAAMLAERVEAM